MLGNATERGQEPLRVPGRCEPFHRPFPLPGGLMRVLDPIVEVLRAAMLDRCQQLAVGDPVAAEFVGDDHPRHVLQVFELGVLVTIDRVTPSMNNSSSSCPNTRST